MSSGIAATRLVQVLEARLLRNTAPGFIDVDALFVSRRSDIESHIRKRVHCRETSADLASDIYLKIKRIRPVFHTEADAYGYLFKMAKTVALDYIQLMNRRRRLLETVPQVVVPEAEVSAEARVVANSQMRIVEGALDELPEKAREMLYMWTVLSMTHEEIAKSLGVSLSLVEKYMTLARRHCLGRLRQVEARAARREAELDRDAGDAS
jgi:RNA polymerase sigma-19 factor, ECF subfamily